MKALAFYLPQYHEIEENNQWWGKGYTEWTAVKDALPFSKAQVQPRVPLNNNYYDLSEKNANTWKWQADLANSFGIHGFVIYHYWFKTGKQLLEKPMEILLSHKEININYCVCWANETWTRTWYGTKKETLMKQEYGDEKEWKNHFNYLLQFFLDDRYIKIDGKPMINIYHTHEIACLKEMLELWEKLSLKAGFKGIYVVSGNTGSKIDTRTNLFNAYYNFEPSYTQIHKCNYLERVEYLCEVFMRTLYNKFSHKKVLERPINGNRFIKRMLRRDSLSGVNIFPGVFPQWDNTPRRKYKGTFFKNMGATNFRKQIQNAKNNYPNSDFLYINAWNEWGEGAYLEPDETDKYTYLEIVKSELIR